MITIDFTEQVVEAHGDEERFLATLMTGSQPPPGGQVDDEDSVTWRRTVRRSKKISAFQHNTRSSTMGANVMSYRLTERHLEDEGDYDVFSRQRNGPIRTFLLSFAKVGEQVQLTIRKGSSPAIWICGDNDPLHYKGTEDDLTFDFQPGPVP